MALLLAIAFADSFGLYRFFDDWSFPGSAESARATGLTWRFIIGANGRHWSPLWNALVVINFHLAGWESDTAIRLFTMALQIVALIWFVKISESLGLSRGATLVGLGVLGLHKVSAVTLYSFDTYSQFGADLVTWAVGGLGLVALFGAECRARNHLRLAIGLLPVGLLMKEQALSGAAALLFVLACKTVRDPRRDRPWNVGAALAVIGVVAAFASARWLAGTLVEPSGLFHLCVTCAPENLVVLLGPIFLPLRSLMVMDAWRARPMGLNTLILAATAAALLASALVAGLVRRSRLAGETSKLWMLIAFLLLSGVPVIFLGRVGLLYTHTAVFWYALLVAEAVEGWLASVHGRGSATLIVALVASAYIVALGAALRGNLGSARRTSDRAFRWLNQYTLVARQVPQGSALLVRIAQRERNSGDYSLLRMTTPEYLIFVTPHALQHRLGPGVTVVLDWGPDEAAQAMSEAAARREGTYQIYRRGEQLELMPWSPRALHGTH